LLEDNLKKQNGFSLLEVMVVLVIIGLILGMVVPNLMGNKDTADKQKVAVDIQQLENALDMYKLQQGYYPTTDQGLEALVTAPNSEPLPRNYPQGGYIKRLPDDPWGSPYQLVSPGEMGTVDIFSTGPDRTAGTDDDIGNWNMDGKEPQN
jgi:general secretion pathway protein G